MKLRLIAVGRIKAGPERDLFQAYAKRLSPGLALVEVEERRKLPPDALMAREAELLLAAIGTAPRSVVVALSEDGKTLGSRDFAGRLRKWQESGVAEIAFVVGGAGGLAPAIRQRADLLLSLGAMTWPHLLVRGMLAEQLYRAQTILAGHPYHRD